MSTLAWTAEQITVSGGPTDAEAVRVAGRLLHLGKDIAVRSYRETDRSAVRQLCCETGFLGNPVDPLFQDRELFADLFTKPYLDYEPGWALIAEAEGRVVGYLLGSVRPDFNRILMRSGFQTVSRMILRLMLGRYAKHPRSRQFIGWLITAGFWEQPEHPGEAAHLHFNVHRAYRGRGVARRLWEVFEQRLRSARIKRCYGAFFSYPKRKPEAVYARFGFREFARCPTTLFESELAGPVEVVCVCKEL
jgi:GNAT superfamily N-acetyltransferase